MDIMKFLVTALVASSGIASFVILGACDKPPPWFVNTCRDRFAESCLEAGVDGNQEETSSAAADLGLDMERLAPCTVGRCLPSPEGNEADSWAAIPLSLWVGPVGQAPSKCPDDPTTGTPIEKYRLFDKLTAESAKCPECTCEASIGSCDKVMPESIQLHAGNCSDSNAFVTAFDNPADWNGTCTPADSIAPGAKCPPNGQTLCAQYVSSSALAPPENDACEPVAKADVVITKSTWEIEALACDSINPEAKSCGSESDAKYCVNHPGPGWLQCTHRKGVHAQCPSNYIFKREVLYPEKPVDTRGCSACECDKPTGTSCSAALVLSPDSNCNTTTPGSVQIEISSTSEMCYKFLSSGPGIGSKAIVNRKYQSGQCTPSVSEPIGSAQGDESNAITFCCAAPVDESGHEVR